MPADLTEELARIIGYEHIDTTLMDDVLPPQRRNHKLETEERNTRYSGRLWPSGNHQLLV